MPGQQTRLPSSPSCPTSARSSGSANPAVAHAIVSSSSRRAFSTTAGETAKSRPFRPGKCLVDGGVHHDRLVPPNSDCISDGVPFAGCNHQCPRRVAVADEPKIDNAPAKRRCQSVVGRPRRRIGQQHDIVDVDLLAAIDVPERRDRRRSGRRCRKLPSADAHQRSAAASDGDRCPAASPDFRPWRAAAVA